MGVRRLVLGGRVSLFEQFSSGKTRCEFSANRNLMDDPEALLFDVSQGGAGCFSVVKTPPFFESQFQGRSVPFRILALDMRWGNF